MKTRLPTASIVCVALGALLTVAKVPAATLYVWRNSPSPSPPYTNWATAARNIQRALDAAQAGDTVRVTNGVFTTGGRAVHGTMTNRVVVDKPVRVESVNGPTMTVIQGYQVPGTTNGDGAIRCVYLTNGAVLSGFTLTNGATRNSGDWGREQTGGGVWCESTNVLVTNCTLTANSASSSGGGAYWGTLNNCTLTRNSARESGGGAYFSTLNNCALAGNSASSGGGVARGTLNNCTLTGNSAAGQYARGGGASGGTLNNCILYYNTATTGSNYYDIDYVTTLNYCCTAPLPASGAGNTSAEPQLASFSHLSAGSPCRGAGSALYASKLDIDGEPWANPPSIGCDEYSSGKATGPLSVAFQAAYTNVAVGFEVAFMGQVEGRASVNRWRFGDGTVVSNRLHAKHTWTSAGDYTVRLTAYNEEHPSGVTASLVVRVMATVHYVSVGSAAPVAPYTNWAGAARNIQQAVNVAIPGALVLVSNGVYSRGGKAVYGIMTNRVAVDKPVRVESVNGPTMTVIQGYQVPGTTNGDGAIRCVYLTNGAVLSGFTLTNGATRNLGDYKREQSGGGVGCESMNALVTNCTLVGNSAYWEGGGVADGTLHNCTLIGNSVSGRGGGAYGGTLSNCRLSSNSASGGGGAADSILNNCTLTGNSAKYGGGVSFGTLNNCTLTGNSTTSAGGGADHGSLNNCILYYNTAASEPNFAFSTINYCCTTPLSPGVGNITNVPAFVDYSGGNLRLQSNSPCINAGNNAYATGITERGGNPRIAGGTVDMGAYEFQMPASQISYAWLQQYGLPTDGSADTADPDNDTRNNGQEWRCGTNPTNASSVLRLLKPMSNGDRVAVSWPSVPGVMYFLERSTDLSASPVFQPLATNLPGQAGTTTYLDTNAPGLPPCFYRVGVQY